MDSRGFEPYIYIYHSTRCEVGTLLVLLAIPCQAVKGVDTIRYQVVGFEKIEVLPLPRMISTPHYKIGKSRRTGSTYIVIDANIDILASLLLLLDKASSQASTAGVDNATALLPLDRGVETQVLSTRQAKSSELLFVAKLLGSILHQDFEFCQSFLNF